MNDPIPRTLMEWERHFSRLFGPRNLSVNGPFPERAMHFNDRIGKVANAVRKGQKMAPKLAALLSYYFSLIDYFSGRIDLTRSMVAKFPSYGCSYCHEKPCGCAADHRPDSAPKEIDERQCDWELREWQCHLGDVYGPAHKKSAGGIYEIISRLFTEMAEFQRLIVRGPDTPVDPIEMLLECEREAADVLSWICALANFCDVDLQLETESLYLTCPSCKKIPCGCPLIFLSEDGGTMSTVGGKKYTPR